MKKARCSFCGEGGEKVGALVEGTPIRISCSIIRGEGKEEQLGEISTTPLGEISTTPFICGRCVDRCKELLSRPTETSGPKKIPETDD